MTEQTQSERDILIQRATTLGLTFAKNISETKLRELIDAELSESVEAETEESLKRKEAQKLREEQAKLIRVQITPMNPAKSSLNCELFSFSNDVFSEKRVIQFNVPWHVPQAMLDHIRSIEFRAYRDIKTPRGGVVQEAYSAPAYAVNVLPPITEEELEQIKKKQLAEGF